MKRLLEQVRLWWQSAERGRAWAGYDVPGPSGLTPLQERCEVVLTEQLTRRGMSLTERVVEGEQERYVRARLGDTAWTLWIYLDQVQLTGPEATAANLERWDAPTPEGLIAEYARPVSAVLDVKDAASLREPPLRARGAGSEGAVQQGVEADEAR